MTLERYWAIQPALDYLHDKYGIPATDISDIKIHQRPGDGSGTVTATFVLRRPPWVPPTDPGDVPARPNAPFADERTRVVPLIGTTRAETPTGSHAPQNCAATKANGTTCGEPIRYHTRGAGDSWYWAHVDSSLGQDADHNPHP